MYLVIETCTVQIEGQGTNVSENIVVEVTTISYAEKLDQVTLHG